MVVKLEKLPRAIDKLLARGGHTVLVALVYTIDRLLARGGYTVLVALVYTIDRLLARGEWAPSAVISPDPCIH
jgi:hypothetical protein